MIKSEMNNPNGFLTIHESYRTRYAEHNYFLRSSHQSTLTTTRKTPGRKRKSEDGLTLDERHKLALKRERNREAAARSRQKKQDTLMSLEKEVNFLIYQKAALESQIRAFIHEEQSYDFNLKNHFCLRTVKREPLDSFDFFENTEIFYENFTQNLRLDETKVVNQNDCMFGQFANGNTVGHFSFEGQNHPEHRANFYLEL